MMRALITVFLMVMALGCSSSKVVQPKTPLSYVTVKGIYTFVDGEKLDPKQARAYYLAAEAYGAAKFAEMAEYDYKRLEDKVTISDAVVGTAIFAAAVAADAQPSANHVGHRSQISEAVAGTLSSGSPDEKSEQIVKTNAWLQKAADSYLEKRAERGQ